MDIDLCLAVDSWACTQLIMPMLFPDAQSWMQAASKRQEIPVELFGTLSPARFRYNLEFCSYLYSPYFPNSPSDMKDALIKNWLYDLSHSILPSPATSVILPVEIVRGHHPPFEVIDCLIPWIRLIRSKQLKPYWDVQEGIGLKLSIPSVFQSHLFKVLKPMFKLLNAMSLWTQLRKDQRFSLFEGNFYLAGPAGLINHACSKHSNVNLDCHLMEVRCNALTISSGEPLRMTYASESELLEHRGFTCNMCRLVCSNVIFICKCENFFTHSTMLSNYRRQSLPATAQSGTVVMPPLVPTTACDALTQSAQLLRSWFNSLSKELSLPGRKRGFGRVSSHLRSACFFTAKCSCAYKFDEGMAEYGIPFPIVLYEILEVIMPICGIHSRSWWPDCAHVNWYANGYVF